MLPERRSTRARRLNYARLHSTGEKEDLESVSTEDDTEPSGSEYETAVESDIEDNLLSQLSLLSFEEVDSPEFTCLGQDGVLPSIPAVTKIRPMG